MSNTTTVPTGTENKKMIVSLKEMMERVATEPKSRYIYSGIKEGSVGIVFGPSKSGKTMYCENLGMAIASGQTSFLGLPLDIENRNVLFVSLEEWYKNRTERNIKQVAKLAPQYGTDWLDERYKVVTEEMPTYISTSENWRTLYDAIVESGAGTVILDSITRMCEGIEESTVAQSFMRKLKALALKANVTIIAIHHTTKMLGQPMGIDNIAGSRVIAQELDFMIGINRTLNGKHYVKNVAFRYAQCDSEKVTTFYIDDSCWLQKTGEVPESKLLQSLDGRTDETNTAKVLAQIQAADGGATDTVLASDIESALVDSEIMSKPTMYAQLKKLVADGSIVKVSQGKYKLAA